MDPVIHFELPYGDRVRMARFYEQTFGWQTQDLGEAMGNYVVATTTESDEGGPLKPGAINGGFFAKAAAGPAQHPTLVIAVEDVAKAMEKVRQTGGTVVGEPMDIPGIGKYVSINDTEGNRVSLLQPLPRQRGPKAP